MNALVTIGKAGRKCGVCDCDRTVSAKGLCLMHYKRLRKHGSTRSTRAEVREGDTFHQLTALRLHDSVGRRKWVCMCACGNESVVGENNLVRGHTKSCGCKFIAAVTRHGQSTTKEYRAWVAMRSRCHTENTPYFKNYGGRGIGVCARWDSFDLFLADMGSRPSARHSIERKNVNGDYEPGNCCWAVPKTQARNKRSTVYVSLDGSQISLADAVERSGLKYRTVHHRIFSRGWSACDALTLPASTKYSPHRKQA